MAIILKRQELFDPKYNGGITTYSGSNSGSFDWVSGSLYLGCVGPQSSVTASSSGSYGWSAKNLSGSGNPNIAYFKNFDSNTQACGMISAWINTTGELVYPSGLQDELITLSSNGGPYGINFYNYANGGPDLLNWVAQQGDVMSQNLHTPHNQWFWVGIAWYHTGGNYDYAKVFMMTGSQATPSLIFDGQYQAYGNSINYVSFGDNVILGPSNLLSRFGIPSVYSVDSASYSALGYTLSAYQPDQIAPSTGSNTWYVNTVSGSDTNNGLSTSTAWSSSAKLLQELIDMNGILGNANTSSNYPAGMGDKIVLNTTGAPLDVYRSFNIYKPGIYITSAQSSSFVFGSTASYAEIKMWEAIPSSSWALVPGRSFTYFTTASGTITASQTAYADPGQCALWENDKWTNWVYGATYNSVSASIDSVAGSFYYGNGSIYYHPFGNTNPITDGKIYTRSRVPADGVGSYVINVNADKLMIDQLKIRKSSCKYTNTSTDTPASLAINIGDVYPVTYPSLTGPIIVKNCYCDYAGKHVVGAIMSGNANNLPVTFSNVQAEQCSPGSWGANGFIVFNGGSVTGNSILFDSCTCISASGLVGSTTGQSNNSYFSHNSSGQNQFSSVTIHNCNLGYNTVIPGFSTKIFNVISSSVGQIQSIYSTASIDMSILQNIFTSNAGASVNVKNSIITLPTQFYVDGNFINGQVSMSNCTVDFRNNLATSFPTTIPPIFSITPNSTSSLYFYNNIVALNQPFTIFGGYSASLLSDYNLYVTTASYIGSSSFGLSGTQSFVTFQSNGRDLHSQVISSYNSLLLNPNYSLISGSPAINAGITQNYYYDITGQLFPYRNSIGAYDFYILRNTPSGEIQCWGAIISSDNGGSGNVPSNVFDGNFGTFFDSTNSQGGWVGLDFGIGNNVTLTSYKLAPRASDSNGFYENRVNGSQIQGCGDPSFSASVVIIDTIPNPATSSNQPSFPMFGRGYYTERFVPNNTSSFRCLRYYASASNSYCDISELRFIASASGFGGSNCQPVTPTLSFAGGLYPNQAALISITSRTTSATIYYTINGTTPTTSSLIYGGPFTLNCSNMVTMSAIAYDTTCATASSEISAPAYFQGTGFVQGTRFYDNRGIVMNNYSGHIYDNTSIDGKYYWFGMFVDVYQNPANSEPPYTEGLWLYSSHNLYNWTLVGNILGNGVSNEWAYLERPHVIYNNSTNKYVLWAHAANGAGNANSASIATASAIIGPWGWANDIYNPLGNTGFLDCNLFKDTNNIGYAIYSFGTTGSGLSAGVKIVQLTNDYLSMTTASFTHSIGNRESPVMFKYNNLYYVITSQGNFYDSTNTFAVTSSWATSPTGSYTSQSLYKGQAFGDPIGTVYNAQPSFALPINNGVLLGMDFWYSSSLSSSKQVWMPLQFNADNSVSLPVPLPATWSFAQYFQSNVWSNLNNNTI